MTVLYDYDFPSRWGRATEDTVDTPNFKELRASGADLPYNNYKLYEFVGRAPYGPDGAGGQITERSNRAVNGLIYCLNAGEIVDSVLGRKSIHSLDNLKNEVHLRVQNKVRHRKINLGVTLGEFHETADFVQEAMLRTYRSYKSFRKGRVGEALSTLTGRKDFSWKDIPGALSNNWLAYSFGFRPLAKDVSDSLTILEKGLEKGIDPITVRSGTKLFLSKRMGTLPESLIEMQGTVQVSSKVRVVVDDPTWFNLEQVGLTNPLSVAWELVPWSFVVDWFIPVNRFIQGIFPPKGVSVNEGYVYTKVNGTTRYETQHLEPHPLFPDEEPLDTSAYTWERLKHREVYSSWPTPSLVIPDLSLSKWKVATGMALLYSTLERK